MRRGHIEIRALLDSTARSLADFDLPRAAQSLRDVAAWGRGARWRANPAHSSLLCTWLELRTVLAIKQRDARGARKTFFDLLSAFPVAGVSPVGMANLGAIFVISGDADRALAVLDNVPNDHAVYRDQVLYWKASALNNLGLHSSAARCLESDGVDGLPANVVVKHLTLMASTYDAIGLTDAATETSARAVNISRRELGARHALTVAAETVSILVRRQKG